MILQVKNGIVLCFYDRFNEFYGVGDNETFNCGKK